MKKSGAILVVILFFLVLISSASFASAKIVPNAKDADLIIAGVYQGGATGLDWSALTIYGLNNLKNAINRELPNTNVKFDVTTNPPNQEKAAQAFADKIKGEWKGKPVIIISAAHSHGSADEYQKRFVDSFVFYSDYYESKSSNCGGGKFKAWDGKCFEFTKYSNPNNVVFIVAGHDTNGGYPFKDKPEDRWPFVDSLRTYKQWKGDGLIYIRYIMSTKYGNTVFRSLPDPQASNVVTDRGHWGVAASGQNQVITLETALSMLGRTKTIQEQKDAVSSVLSCFAARGAISHVLTPDEIKNWNNNAAYNINWKANDDAGKFAQDCFTESVISRYIAESKRQRETPTTPPKPTPQPAPITSILQQANLVQTDVHQIIGIEQIGDMGITSSRTQEEICQIVGSLEQACKNSADKNSEVCKPQPVYDAVVKKAKSKDNAEVGCMFMPPYGDSYLPITSLNNEQKETFYFIPDDKPLVYANEGKLSSFFTIKSDGKCQFLIYPKTEIEGKKGFFGFESEISGNKIVLHVGNPFETGKAEDFAKRVVKAEGAKNIFGDDKSKEDVSYFCAVKGTESSQELYDGLKRWIAGGGKSGWINLEFPIDAKNPWYSAGEKDTETAEFQFVYNSVLQQNADEMNSLIRGLPEKFKGPKAFICYMRYDSKINWLKTEIRELSCAGAVDVSLNFIGKSPDLCSTKGNNFQCKPACNADATLERELLPKLAWGEFPTEKLCSNNQKCCEINTCKKDNTQNNCRTGNCNTGETDLTSDTKKCLGTNQRCCSSQTQQTSQTTCGPDNGGTCRKENINDANSGCNQNEFVNGGTDYKCERDAGGNSRVCCVKKSECENAGGSCRTGNDDTSCSPGEQLKSGIGFSCDVAGIKSDKICCILRTETKCEAAGYKCKKECVAGDIGHANLDTSCVDADSSKPLCCEEPVPVSESTARNANPIKMIYALNGGALIGDMSALTSDAGWFPTRFGGGAYNMRQIVADYNSQADSLGLKKINLGINVLWAKIPSSETKKILDDAANYDGSYIVVSASHSAGSDKPYQAAFVNELNKQRKAMLSAEKDAAKLSRLNNLKILIVTYDGNSGPIEGGWWFFEPGAEKYPFPFVRYLSGNRGIFGEKSPRGRGVPVEFPALNVLTDKYHWDIAYDRQLQEITFESALAVLSSNYEASEKYRNENRGEDDRKAVLDLLRCQESAKQIAVLGDRNAAHGRGWESDSERNQKVALGPFSSCLDKISLINKDGKLTALNSASSKTISEYLRARGAGEEPKSIAAGESEAAREKTLVNSAIADGKKACDAAECLSKKFKNCNSNPDSDECKKEYLFYKGAITTNKIQRSLCIFSDGKTLPLLETQNLEANFMLNRFSTFERTENGCKITLHSGGLEKKRIDYMNAMVLYAYNDETPPEIELIGEPPFVSDLAQRRLKNIGLSAANGIDARCRMIRSMAPGDTERNVKFPFLLNEEFNPSVVCDFMRGNTLIDTCGGFLTLKIGSNVDKLMSNNDFSNCRGDKCSGRFVGTCESQDTCEFKCVSGGSSINAYDKFFAYAGKEDIGTNCKASADGKPVICSCNGNKLCNSVCWDYDLDKYGVTLNNNNIETQQLMRQFPEEKKSLINLKNCDSQKEDCNDQEVSINPGRKEICTDNIDNNCNNLIDCKDISCNGESCYMYDGNGNRDYEGTCVKGECIPKSNFESNAVCGLLGTADKFSAMISNFNRDDCVRISGSSQRYFKIAKYSPAANILEKKDTREYVASNDISWEGDMGSLWLREYKDDACKTPLTSQGKASCNVAECLWNNFKGCNANPGNADCGKKFVFIQNARISNYNDCKSADGNLFKFFVPGNKLEESNDFMFDKNSDFVRNGNTCSFKLYGKNPNTPYLGSLAFVFDGKIWKYSLSGKMPDLGSHSSMILNSGVQDKIKNGADYGCYGLASFRMPANTDPPSGKVFVAEQRTLQPADDIMNINCAFRVNTPLGGDIGASISPGDRCEGQAMLNLGDLKTELVGDEKTCESACGELGKASSFTLSNLDDKGYDSVLLGEVGKCISYQNAFYKIKKYNWNNNAQASKIAKSVYGVNADALNWEGSAGSVQLEGEYTDSSCSQLKSGVQSSPQLSPANCGYWDSVNSFRVESINNIVINPFPLVLKQGTSKCYIYNRVNYGQPGYVPDAPLRSFRIENINFPSPLILNKAHDNSFWDRSWGVGLTHGVYVYDGNEDCAGNYVRADMNLDARLYLHCAQNPSDEEWRLVIRQEPGFDFGSGIFGGAFSPEFTSYEEFSSIYTVPISCTTAKNHFTQDIQTRSISFTDCNIADKMVRVAPYDLSQSCTPESDSAFCARLGKSCGAVSANDNCGNSRSVGSCGTCNSGQTCVNGQCVGPAYTCTNNGGVCEIGPSTCNGDRIPDRSNPRLTCPPANPLCCIPKSNANTFNIPIFATIGCRDVSDGDLSETKWEMFLTTDKDNAKFGELSKNPRVFSSAYESDLENPIREGSFAIGNNLINFKDYFARAKTITATAQGISAGSGASSSSSTGKIAGITKLPLIGTLGCNDVSSLGKKTTKWNLFVTGDKSDSLAPEFLRVISGQMFNGEIAPVFTNVQRKAGEKIDISKITRFNAVNNKFITLNDITKQLTKATATPFSIDLCSANAPDCSSKKCCSAESCKNTESCTEYAEGKFDYCHDGKDNDRNGAIDCADLSCKNSPFCQENSLATFKCSDKKDNDMNGAIDCADAACHDRECILNFDEYFRPYLLYMFGTGLFDEQNTLKGYNLWTNGAGGEDKVIGTCRNGKCVARNHAPTIEGDLPRRIFVYEDAGSWKRNIGKIDASSDNTATMNLAGIGYPSPKMSDNETKAEELDVKLNDISLTIQGAPFDYKKLAGDVKFSKLPVKNGLILNVTDKGEPVGKNEKKWNANICPVDYLFLGGEKSGYVETFIKDYKHFKVRFVGSISFSQTPQIKDYIPGIDGIKTKFETYNLVYSASLEDEGRTGIVALYPPIVRFGDEVRGPGSITITISGWKQGEGPKLEQELSASKFLQLLEILYPNDEGKSVQKTKELINMCISEVASATPTTPITPPQQQPPEQNNPPIIESYGKNKLSPNFIYFKNDDSNGLSFAIGKNKIGIDAAKMQFNGFVYGIPTINDYHDGKVETSPANIQVKIDGINLGNYLKMSESLSFSFSNMFPNVNFETLPVKEKGSLKVTAKDDGTPNAESTPSTLTFSLCPSKIAKVGGYGYNLEIPNNKLNPNSKYKDLKTVVDVSKVIDADMKVKDEISLNKKDPFSGRVAITFESIRTPSIYLLYGGASNDENTEKAKAEAVRIADEIAIYDFLKLAEAINFLELVDNNGAKITIPSGRDYFIKGGIENNERYYQIIFDFDKNTIWLESGSGKRNEIKFREQKKMLHAMFELMGSAPIISNFPLAKQQSLISVPYGYEYNANLGGYYQTGKENMIYPLAMVVPEDKKPGVISKKIRDMLEFCNTANENTESQVETTIVGQGEISTSSATASYYYVSEPILFSKDGTAYKISSSEQPKDNITKTFRIGEVDESYAQIYRFDDYEVEGECNVRVLDENKRVIDSRGGTLELDGAKIDIPSRAFMGNSLVILQKVKVSGCGSLLSWKTILVYSGALLILIAVFVTWGIVRRRPKKYYFG